MADLDQPLAPQQRRRDRALAAATAAIMLVVGVGYFVTRDGGPEPDRSVLTAVAERQPHACAAGDLAAGRTTVRSAATTSLTVTMLLAPGREPCSVKGFPSVIVLSGGRPAGVATVTDDDFGQPRRLTVLPDRSVKVTLAWDVRHYCGPVVNDALRLWVAPDLPVEVRGFGASSCSPGDGRPPVRHGPYTYVDPAAERGTVTGVVTLNGGPALGTGEYVTTGQVELAGEPDSYRAPIQPDGSYEIELPAGRYDVTVTTHQWHGGEPYPAGGFDVTGGELNDLSITLPVR